MNKLKPKYLALDVESGGVDEDLTVLEYYFIVLDEKLNELDTLHLLTKPDNGVYKLTASGMSVNKIDIVEHDKNAIPNKDAKTILYNFLNKNTDGGKDKLIWLGHNVHFDRLAVFNNLLTRNSCDKFCKYYVIDTGSIAQVEKARGNITELLGGSLSELLKYFQIDKENDHTAANDIRATIEVYRCFLDDIEPELYNYLNEFYLNGRQ